MFLVLVFVYFVLMFCCVGSSVDCFCCLSQHFCKHLFGIDLLCAIPDFVLFVFLIFSGWGMSMVVRLFNFKISCNVLAGAIEFLMWVCFSAVMICLV